MKTADASIHTIEDITEIVKVREFRTRMDHLARVVHVDYHACATQRELENWVEICRRVASELRRTGCKRAKREDWDRRESYLDASASLIAKVLDGTVKRGPRRPKLRLIQGGKA